MITVSNRFRPTLFLESSFMQEIAQEVAMRQRQNVWVDGSLSDGEWFSTVFQDIRRRYPHYRIAIIHITASESTIRERIARRSAATGRSIPESQIQRSLECPEKSIGVRG
jgi:ribose 1,5-bisphosphokinase PhnN